MANLITGINDDIISQKILEAFTAGITPLKAFATDFSDDAAQKGDRVSVMRTIVADAAIDKVSHADYTIQDADSDSVEVVLGQPKYVSYALDDTEIANSSMLNISRFAIQKGFALAKAVFQNILSVVTNANYGAAAYTGTIAGFDADDVVDLSTAANTADMPEEMRSLILSSALFGNVLKDSAIQDASAYGDRAAIVDGAIGKVGGFSIFRSNLIPANAEGLNGFIAHPAALAIAMRYLQPQEGNTYHRAERLTGEGGITIGLRDWYDNDSGRRKVVYECVFGKVVGISGGIKRITAT